ncbi:DEAD/DEAH box helicase family protein [Patescibacteria group bacterium]|nr:DEAD/DEAH box helicase family protein [Patescibacteria group bacterium]
MRLYLQNIVDDFSFDNLPAKWQGFDYAKFSQNKTLFDFQKQGLKNATKALYRFYKDEEIRLPFTYLKDESKIGKKAFFRLYQQNGFEEKFDYDLKKKQDGKTAKFLLEYDKDYPVINNKILFEHFINRMSFWMATGSGKTLIIVKLIELLGHLINEKEIPKNDILFLAHRNDLLEQFKNHIEEFNSFNFETKINLKSLKEYESVKRENALPFAKREITVFYYRSDLLSDERKEKIIDYKNYDNNGKWHILLDEAHKGDKEDSKRQILYSILSRNGFLFNFSATFTDPRDYATCAFNFNLSKFIEEGYGKHIYVSGSEVTAFKSKDDFSKTEKQKIVLKSLVLLAYINKHFEKIRKADKRLYHRPLLLTLVNSVDTKEADLKLFFGELEKIAKGNIDNNLLDKAKEELIAEFGNNLQYEFENISVAIDKNIIIKIDYKDILRQILNSDSAGNIEVLKIPGNRNELIFKLQTSERPFALIKIGDISGWLKEELEGYEINESFENESYFKKINRDDSAINILMGSRSFYEGWDSNRPNILLFVNIGVGSDAKKFVLQSVGRGVRIDPMNNKKYRRMLSLFNAKEISGELFNNVKQNILSLESLFVFGTNAENLKEIIKALKEEKQEKNLGDVFSINKDAEKHNLLIPAYKETDKIFAEEKEPQKYSISKNDFELASSYFKHLGEKVALVKYECEPKVLKTANKSIQNEDEKDKRYDFAETRSVAEPDLLIDRILNYFSVKMREFDTFKKLENEIVHFKRIKFSDGDKYDEIKKKIEEIKQYPEKQKELDKQYGKISRGEFARKQMSLFDSGSFEIKNQKVKIKYLANHYYLPVIVSENEKVDYLNHIIDVESEIKFIEQLEEYLQKEDNTFKQFDWWMFSKLDQTLDEVHIPYYSPKENTMAKFKPDFIFWMQKGNEYIILFVDPKGTEHADGYRKIDGYANIFENKELGDNKKFPYNGFSIKTKLLLKPKKGIAETLENYRKYWFDNFGDFAAKLNK